MYLGTDRTGRHWSASRDVLGLGHPGGEEERAQEGMAWRDSSSILSHSREIHQKDMTARESAGDEVYRIAVAAEGRYCIGSAGSFHRRYSAYVERRFEKYMLQVHRADRMIDSQTDGPCHRCLGGSYHKPEDCKYSAVDTARGRMSAQTELPVDDDNLLAGSENGMGVMTVKLAVGSHTAATAEVGHSRSTRIVPDPGPGPGVEPEGSCWRRRQR